MNYRLHQNGSDAGEFPIEELRRRRRSGELTGSEYLWREGTEAWKPIDDVLAAVPGGPLPPPLPAHARPARLRSRTLWIAGIGTIVLAASLVLVGLSFLDREPPAKLPPRPIRTTADRKTNGPTKAAVSRPTTSPPPMTEAESEAASSAERERFAAELGKSATARSPVPRAASIEFSKSGCARDVERHAREFRIHAWLADYRENARHDHPWDAEAEQLIGKWIDSHYGDGKTNAAEVARWCDRFAAMPDCDDPLVQIVTGLTAADPAEETRRLERGLAGYSGSRHKAYPRWVATMALARILNPSTRLARLDDESERGLAACLADGSVRPEDQGDLAEILFNGWGRQYFNRSSPGLHMIPRRAGEAFGWLADVIEGQKHIEAAWEARGGDYANAVKTEQWVEFERHLAAARTNFTRAYDAHPEYPLAAAQMITVAMGENDSVGMRQWFERAVAVQVDYVPAWTQMRWGLRPRWLGSLDAMLGLGKFAVDTGRFDTEAPLRLFDVVHDLEAEAGLGRGEHLLGNPAVWAQVSRMYEGYLRSPKFPANRPSWHANFAITAHVSGREDVAREHLEAIGWKLPSPLLPDWGRDLSLMSLEVAARTGPATNAIAAAEAANQKRGPAAALDQFRAILEGPGVDEPTARYVRCRQSTLAMEQRLAAGEWVDFLPAGTNDPGWVVRTGEVRREAGGAAEVKPGRDGYLMYSRVSVGAELEVRGEFECLEPLPDECQVALVLGLPDPRTTRGWLSLRIDMNAEGVPEGGLQLGWQPLAHYRPSRLKPGRHTFEFRLEKGMPSASVDGHVIIKPDHLVWRSFDGPKNEFHVGIGSFADGKETTVRYHRLEARRLPRNPNGN